MDNDLLAADLRDAFGLGVTDYGIGKTTRIRTGASSAAWDSGFATAGGLAPHSRLAGFEIIDEIGRGGMGVVYRARQLALDREVALKILPDRAGAGTRLSRRFQTEAKAAARLNHTNVVPVYAQGEEGGRLYYAMKLVKGESLDAVIKSHPELLSSAHAASGAPMPSQSKVKTSKTIQVSDVEAAPASAPRVVPHPRSRDDFAYIARLIAEVAEGLAHAHANGVLHRDIKPHNLIFGDDRHLYITDFGLAYLQGDPHLTVDGEVMGTPSYVSPEQARGGVGHIDARSDVFSLGVTLYEMITGRRPFDGETRDQILHAVCESTPPRPRTVDSRIPSDLETICLRAMEKAPQDRYQLAADLAEDLRRFSEGRPILARRTPIARRVFKWMRRRPALSGAVAAFTALIGVTVAWGISAAAARQVQREQHLDAAYHQIVHLDILAPGKARSDLAEAESLGASGAKLEIVRALFDIADFKPRSAIRRIENLIRYEPQNIEALYLLALAQSNNLQFEDARATRRNADAISVKRTPEEFFFRALAAHRTDPAIAVDSYGLAVTQSAASNLYFPQAVLHLARAYNQQMYNDRDLDLFDEAESSLKQLIKNAQYGGYPYYLLAITHRIAGEIYESSPAAGSQESAAEMYQMGLEWARNGQIVAPENERPVTSEAFILERMGLLDEALAARTRAISGAIADQHRCEGYHYRWRLAYWLGSIEVAFDDIENHQECMPNDWNYRYIYPALLHAESGNMAVALSTIDQFVSDQPTSAQAIITAAGAFKLLGRSAHAVQVLMDHRDDLIYSDPSRDLPEGWLETLLMYMVGEATFDDLQALAYTSSTPRQLMGEAYFHMATESLAAGDREDAEDGFRMAYRAFDTSMGYTYMGKLFLHMVQSDEAWPRWIPLEPESHGAKN